jgi:SAM-dependent methyltransferase
MELKYIHSEKEHNLASPKQIVPHLMRLVQPKSVVDIGCGIGTFLYCFKESGVSDVLGVDGHWADKNLMRKYLSPEEFKEADLEQPLTLDRKYDLAISLEVAEHVSEESADIFVENLLAAGQIIAFSAAIPLQGGQNHVNEQWLTYWEKKFVQRGYIMADVLRPLLWDNPEVFVWYRQNIVFFVPQGFAFSVPHNPITNIVHPELFYYKSRELTHIQQNYDRIVLGKMPAFSYVKYLLKAIFGVDNLNSMARCLTSDRKK